MSDLASDVFEENVVEISHAAEHASVLRDGI
jgi:hypothetical protein